MQHSKVVRARSVTHSPATHGQLQLLGVPYEQGPSTQSEKRSGFTDENSGPGYNETQQGDGFDHRTGNHCMALKTI